MQEDQPPCTCLLNSASLLLHCGCFQRCLQIDSHELSANRGRQELNVMIDHFSIRPPQETLEASNRLYKLAVQRGFTRGRSVTRVAAACLYIWCRCVAAPAAGTALNIMDLAPCRRGATL